MTVYVGPVHNIRGLGLALMTADTDEELHAMAWRVGMLATCYEGGDYLVPNNARAMAISYGATCVDDTRKIADDRARRLFG